MGEKNKHTTNEQKVVDLLNSLDGASFKLMEDKYHSYDIQGSVDGLNNVGDYDYWKTPYFNEDKPPLIIVEVKERDVKYMSNYLMGGLYIETEKIKEMYITVQQERHDRPIIPLLCCSIGGRHYLYPIGMIVKCPKTNRNANDQTSNELGFNKSRVGVKKNKEFFRFNFNDFFIELSNREIGYQYERREKQNNNIQI